MLRYVFLSFSLLFVSCEFLSSKEALTERRVTEKLAAIDWDIVDEYPMFDDCLLTQTKEEQRQCFQTTMLKKFSKALEELELKVDSGLNDTVNVNLVIDEHGFMAVKDIEENGKVMELLPNFEREVTDKLNDLVTVKPAIKRGVFVKVSVRLPLILKTEE